MIREQPYLSLASRLTPFNQPRFVWVAGVTMPIFWKLPQLPVAVRNSSHRHPPCRQGRRVGGLSWTGSPESLLSADFVRRIRFPD